MIAPSQMPPLAPRLILASTSATRRGLLLAAGLEFEPVASSVDEVALREEYRASGRTNSQLAEDLAAAKALAVSRTRPDHLVIGADQMLLVGSETLDKPGSRSGVIASLRRLRGRAHTLVSGVALAEDGHVVWRHTATADLIMRDLTDGEIEHYADRAGTAVLGSVGAYHIEGLGLTLFSAIAGDHTTILGLPMLPLLDQLRKRGLSTP